MRLGSGFFQASSRPSRDLGVLLARQLAGCGPLRVLDLMAGCGIRALRYGQESQAEAVWANDADPDRLALLQANLAPLRLRLPTPLRVSTLTAQKLLADCLIREERFELVDLDAFGCPSALLPLALDAVSFGGVLYVASSDGRSPTGHDRPAAIRLLGAAARAHPASWELALRLQLGVIARTAWAMGRGLEPLLSFSEGRTFRTAVRLRRRPAEAEERQLGMTAYCHRCGDQQVQPLISLRAWAPCCGADRPLAVSGPLWIGPLQHGPTLTAMAPADPSLGREANRLLARLADDEGLPARCWPTAEIGKRLGGGPPALAALLSALRGDGWSASASALMPAQVRTDAPWPVVLGVAEALNR
ncbi:MULTISPECIES: N2,N2-dimethylguanosine tRNA methyltransferase [Synechococcaceae]|uniref:N2,N2-dimethylguanosine tRNA methyltransferase n=1 Tax=Synechococcaceae TaxID=1890426 RepID=UPI0008FF23B6|nr:MULTISPECIES: N2,N2-dimethylguanosine tRNA methyltransferase [Synechococcaceae]APD48773.1 N2,N2-dimethylguanosine tRNA methyltransferase [Synechococcus sp. SynAce01]MCT4364684.1 N2,N2-dimethylguanosine tRNA methyltransferase [Candidatus Regnicoccus frigidus MAG-AL1]MCT4366594.1 N2,N2-dimethylguanosine tRNA methyltransferase [Candidatus Regnicoccus frigidus MAG-AL2]